MTNWSLLNPEAEAVWQASEDYVVLALKYFENPGPHFGDESVATKKERYRVYFLFPNLPERSRQDLCRVRCRFLGVHKTRQRQRDENVKDTGAGFEYQEAEAVEWQKDAESAFMGFSKIQRDILREKFLVGKPDAGGSPSGSDKDPP
jgi:hypothetical protein